MDPFITPICDKVIDCAVLPVVKQVGYLFHYKDNLKELDKKVNQLEGARQIIQHMIEEEERKHANQVEDSVQDWLDRVDKLVKEAKEFVEDPHHAGVECHQCSCPNLRLRHKLSRMAKTMVEEATKLVEEGKFERVTFSSPTDYMGRPFKALTFGSRMPMMNEMMEDLKDPNKRMIGVYGLGGVGKTTLAKQVANKAKRDKLFSVVVEAKVGEDPQLERIQDAIAELLDMQWEEKSVEKRAYSLCKRIEREKSILVILDDVWTTIELGKLGIPDPSTMNSEDRVPFAITSNLEKGKLATKAENVVCKILMTSRNEDILLQMGSEKNFRLELLTEKEAWDLFEVKACLDVNGKHSDIQHIATQVAQKCEGLPILINTMATTLKGRSIQFWRAAVNKLRKSGAKQKDEIIRSGLELCYNLLESDEVKTLFLLCGAAGFNHVSDLLKYGIGLGIFKHLNTVEDARDNLYIMIDSLKASCLLLDDTDKELVTMHDVVRDTAISIASGDQYFFTKTKDTNLKEWPKDEFFEGCPLIRLRGCIHKLPERLDCPKLEFFGLNSYFSPEIPQSFFEGMGNLKVLDLTNMIMSSLPTSLASLTKLKTLCLDFCDIENMAEIGALKSLEVLSLLDSSMTQLPCEIGKLTHLRMLDLRRSSIEVIPPNVISNLIKLEELYMGNSSIKWGVENSSQQNKTASLAELQHLINLSTLEIQILDPWMQPKDFKFQKLGRYEIIIGDTWDWSEKYKASKTLKLKCDSSFNLEHWVKALIETVENLYLDGMNDISNVLYQLNEEGFPLLKHFHIQNNTEIQHIVNSIEGNQADHVSFPKLETLVLMNLSNLEKICHGLPMVNSFSHLRVIKVISCDQLKYLILLSMVKVLSQLLEIQVSKCNSMKSIVFMEPEDNGITIDKIEFTQLFSLTLQYLPMMGDFCSIGTNIPTSFFSAKLAFPNLETLIVKDCGGLKYLFSPFMVDSFSNLKQLEISNCQMMEEIIATQGRNDDIALAEVGFSKLEKMTINNMENLKAIWHYQFDKLKMLKVENCHKLRNIFPSHMQRTFQSLETLTVIKCNSVEEIFELSANGETSTTALAVTAQLEKLDLLRLPKLKRIWSKDPLNTTHFHNLQSVDVAYCEILEYIFPFSIANNLLQLEEITVRQANVMKEIVSEKEGPPMDSTVKFEFNHLSSLVLLNVHEIERFYAGNHSLACPSLKKLYVFNCRKLNLFERQVTSGQSEGISDNQLHVSMQQHLFKVEEVIPNLGSLEVHNEAGKVIFLSESYWRRSSLARQITYNYQQRSNLRDTLQISDFVHEESAFPNWLLQYLSPLKTLVVQHSALKKIFQDESSSDCTRLKALELRSLSKLEHICKEGFQIDPVLEVLESLYVDDCPKLTHLVPSSVTFTHLTYMEVRHCSGMIYLFTSSTARSLINLTHLKIEECDAIEEVVTQEANETEDDEIVFSSLEKIELEYLPRLNKFCSSMCSLKFPMLAEVVVKECKRMKVFSVKEAITPNLQKLIAYDYCWTWNGNEDGDLNRSTKSRIFHDLATRQEDKGKGKESSSSKEHVDTEKQERYKLPSLSDKGKQKEHVTLEDPSRSAGGSGKSHDSEITPYENLLPNPTTSSMTTENREKELYDRNDPSGENPSITGGEAIHPAPPESQTSYTSYLDISVHNSPYLEAGVARHPQVLEWLNTRKQRRVFASSFFSLFAEVTRLLRTTRRDELSHDDRHYITQCCNSLEAVGFDASWLSYVGGCMKECDEAEAEMEMVKSSLEETEAKASTLKAQIVSMKNELASVEASLVLLHHKASKLHDFIES